jgi:tetratricopeptide (TPR) repeat protein
MLRTSLMMVVVVLFISGSARPSLAHKIGDRIVTSQGTHLTIDDRVIDTVDRGTVLTVEGVEKKFLWVSNGRPGWLDDSFAIPLESGIEHFSEIIRKDPKDAGAYYCRGKIASAQGDQDAAIKDFDKSIEIESIASASYLGRANAWNAKGEFDRAIVDYNKALWLSGKQNTELGPKHAVIYNSRGAAHLAKGDQEKALEDFNAALKLDSKQPKTYFNRGNVWKAQEEYGKAIRDYDEALRLDPDYMAAYNNRGSAWFSKGDYDKALADYDEVLRRDAKNIKTRFNRASAWEAKGKHDEAIADFNTVRLLDPKFADAYSAIALIRATCSDSRIRNGNQAIAFATKACELTEWKNPSYLFVLAAAFAEDGQFEAAVKCQTDALEMAPKSQKFRYRERLNLYKSGKAFHELPKGE